MLATAKAIVSPETNADSKTPDGAKGDKHTQTTASGYSLQVEAQKRRWGVETAAVRSMHARKF